MTSTQVNTFKLLDADGSGELDFVEFCATFYLYCTFTWAGLVKYAFDITDVDRSGFLDMNEVESLCRSVYGFTGKRKGEAFRRKENNLLDLEGTLRQFDSDSDGKISFKEFLEQNRKHKLLLYPAFELQHNMRKAVMGDRYWRNREGPHFTEKDIVLHQLKKAMAPHQEDLSAGHKKLNEDVRRKGGLRASRDEEPQRKKKHPRRYGEKASKFVRTLSGRLKLAGSGPTKLVKQLSAKSLKLKRSMSFSNKKKKVAPQRKGMKGSLVAGTHGVTSASGAKRRR